MFKILLQIKTTTYLFTYLTLFIPDTILYLAG